MNKLYVHVGAGKTGSTAIQFYFFNSADCGNLRYLPIGIQHQGHHGIASALMGNQRFDWLHPYDLDRLVREISELANANSTCYLASSEALATSDFIDLGGLEKLKELFCSWNIEVILYVRNQVDLVESTFLQLAKTGAYLGKFGDWYREFRLKRIGDFAETTKLLNTVFGERNVHVFSFDTHQKDLLAPIEMVTNIRVDRSALAVENRSSIWTSFVLQSVALHTGERLIGPKARVIRRVAEQVLGELENRTIVSEALRARIIQDHFEGNEILRQLTGVDLNCGVERRELTYIDPRDIDIEGGKSRLIMGLLEDAHNPAMR